MSTPTSSVPQPATAPAANQPGHNTPRNKRHILRRLAWIAGYAAVRGAATTAGGAAVTAVIWWLHNRT